MPILRNWKVLKYYSQVHGKEMYYLTGRVYNDSRFPNGSEIRTSAVLEIDDGVAQTLNTTYILED